MRSNIGSAAARPTLLPCVAGLCRCFSIAVAVGCVASKVGLCTLQSSVIRDPVRSTAHSATT